MTYLFTNPQAKKWKTFFFLSMLLNLVLIAAIVASNFEKTDESSSSREKTLEKNSDTEKSDINIKEVVKGAENEQVESKSPAQKLSDGDKIAVSVILKDSFFNAFNDSKIITKYAQKLDIPNLHALLSAHISRLLLWDLVLRKDVRKGDEISFIFRKVPEDELKTRDDMPDVIDVLAVSYESKKYDKNFKIFYFKSKKERWGKYYYDDGQMIEKVMKTPPLKDYIQVTSLLHDRRPKHDGVDFKTPTGTPVYSTAHGKVTRTNWLVKYNGYCVEIKIRGKNRTLKYLHLSDVLVKPGDVVKPGDHIANSGNTGKTTAPHLHYQVNRGRRGKIIDPFIFNETKTKYLQGDELKQFTSKKVDFMNRMSKLDNILQNE